MTFRVGQNLDFVVLASIYVVSELPLWQISSYQCEVTKCRNGKRVTVGSPRSDWVSPSTPLLIGTIAPKVCPFSSLPAVYPHQPWVCWKWALFKLLFLSMKCWIHLQSWWHCIATAVIFPASSCVYIYNSPYCCPIANFEGKLTWVFYFIQSNYWRVNVWEMSCNFHSISL